jgi:hypothetical protein
MVPPDKQVGESELRDPRRVFAQELVKQRLVLDLYRFELTHRRSSPKKALPFGKGEAEGCPVNRIDKAERSQVGLWFMVRYLTTNEKSNS